METVELETIARDVAASQARSPRPLVLVESTPEAAWQRARAHPGDLICITGSFFLAADMINLLRN